MIIIFYRSRAKTIVGMACNIVCLITSLIHPYMPETVNTLSQQLNLPIECFNIQEEFIPYFETGHKIGKVKFNYFYTKM